MRRPLTTIMHLQQNLDWTEGEKEGSFCYALTLSLKEETITWLYILST